MKIETLKAYAACMLRSIIYGSSILFTGRLLSSAGAFDVLAIRFLLSAFFFGILILCGKVKLDFKGKNVRLLILTALMEPVVYFILETYGIRDTSTSTAGIIFAFMPVLVLLASRFFLNENATGLQKVFILLRIVGTVIYVLSSSQNGKDSVSGILLLFAAITVDTLYVVLLRKSTREFTPLEVTFAMLVEGAVVFNVINVFIHASKGTLSAYFKPLLDIKMIPGFIFLSILSSIVAATLVNYASSRIPVFVMNAMGGLTTLTTVLCGVIFNRERLNMLQISGLFIILLSVVIVSTIQGIQVKKKDTV